MLDFSLAELLLVIVVAVIFIGPKDVPVIVRAIAKLLRQMKVLSAEIKKTFDTLAEESGIEPATGEAMPKIHLIKGDDGNFYESYDVMELSANKKPLGL